MTDDVPALLRAVLAKLDDRTRLAGGPGCATLGEVFSVYCDRHASRRCKTYRQIRSNFERYLGHLRDLSLDMLTADLIQELHDFLADTRGRATANRTLELLRAMLNRAKRWRIVKGENPALVVEPFRLFPRERFLSADELPRFIAAVDSERKQVNRDFFKMLLFTGQRVSNVMAMRWSEIDFDSRLWLIPAPEMKNNRVGVAVLCDAAIEILKRRRIGARTGWVFPGRTLPGRMGYPSRAWARILRRSGLQNFRVHDLRRTHASWMIKSGASLQITGKALNHRSLTATLVYARLDMDPVRAAVEKGVAAMLAAGGLSGENRAYERIAGVLADQA